MDTAALLPINSTAWERAVAGALTDTLDCEIPVRVKDPALCPAVLLPYLAAEEGVDVWSASWPETLKRSTIAASWEVHRRKGTPAVMDQAVASLGPGWSWLEWWQYGGAPYRFRLFCGVPATGLSLAMIEFARSRANAAKNVRSLMEIETRHQATTTAYVGVFAIVARSIGDLPLEVPAARVAVGVFGLVENAITGEIE